MASGDLQKREGTESIPLSAVTVSEPGPEPRPVGRGEDGRFLPGYTGNTKGVRAETLVAYLRRESRSGIEAAEYVLSVLRDERQSTSMRMEAASWIAAYACGRPVATQVSVEVPMLGAGQDLETWLQGLSTAELRALVDAGGAVTGPVAALESGAGSNPPDALGEP